MTAEDIVSILDRTWLDDQLSGVPKTEIEHKTAVLV
jgi:hypothetical protein